VSVVLAVHAPIVMGAVFAKTERRWVEDIRATVSLAAATVLLLIVFKVIHIPAEPNRFEMFFVKFHYEEILAGVIGFYFGRKS
jgi:predicted Na+-dependent transporter